MLTMNTHCKLQLCLNTFCCTNICTHIYHLYSILFLDSLKMHSKNTYARHIRSWLNCEWKRLGHGKKPIFDTESLPLVSPRSRFLSPFPFDNMSCRIFSFFSSLLTMISLIPVPYQDNGCDCGIFVCRYAYNLYIMRHQKFTCGD